MTDFSQVSPPTADQLAIWDAWLAERPEAVRVHAVRLVPWKVYCLSTTGQSCRVVSFQEGPHGDVTVTAVCWQDWAPALTGRIVFGLNPADIVDREGEIP